jgi:hypothetical protein
VSTGYGAAVNLAKVWPGEVVVVGTGASDPARSREPGSPAADLAGLQGRRICLASVPAQPDKMIDLPVNEFIMFQKQLIGNVGAEATRAWTSRT